MELGHAPPKLLRPNSALGPLASSSQVDEWCFTLLKDINQKLLVQKGTRFIGPLC